MKNIRRVKYDESKEISSYEPKELVSYLLNKYPGDPLGALKLLMNNHEVGFVLGSQTQCILEAILDV